MSFDHKDNKSNTKQVLPILEPDVKPPPIIDYELAHTIQKFRVAKGLTQKELAHAINLPVQIISDYERGSCVKNSFYISKIKNYLGITKHNS